ncbi:MAG: serine hydrolase [Pseudomonadota bacterium]
MKLLREAFDAVVLALAAALSAPVAAEEAPEMVRSDMVRNKNAAAREATRALEALVAGEESGQPLAGAALAILKGDDVIYAAAAGCAEFKPPTPDRAQACARPMTPQTKARVASVSKVAVALAAARLAEEGRIDLDAPITEYLSWPQSPKGARVTIRRMLAHVAGVRDPVAYWAVAPKLMAERFKAEPALFAAPTREDVFAYANINYGLIAGAIERATGARFDEAVADLVLKPTGLDAGFNWSGVSEAARTEGAALYRWSDEEGGWAAQIDGSTQRLAPPPYFPAAEGLDRDAYLKEYRPGDNSTLFSPQGGLRASAEDIARLIRAASAVEAIATPVWRADKSGGNRAEGNDWAKAFAAGMEINEDDVAVAPGRTLIGHAGEAYGLYSGAWRILDGSAYENTPTSDDDLTIGFLVTGVKGAPAPGSGGAFNRPTQDMMRIALRAADAMTGAEGAAAAEEDHPEARPFQKGRDAAFDVDSALREAAQSGKTVALVLGANWCHDSRGLAGRLRQPQFASLIDRGFHLVYVDVGQRDRNIDIARRFGIDELKGTPTVLFVSPEGALLNPDTVHDWRNAASRTRQETLDYFAQFAPRPADSRSH